MTFILFLLLFAVPSSVFACEEAVTEISALRSRLRNVQLSAHETPHSDADLLEGWYSAGSYLMASSVSAVGMGNCTTVYPIVLKDPLDTAALSATAHTVPVQIAGLIRGADNPRAEFDIQVRSCNGVVQYYLKPSPIQSAAYCFEPSSDSPPEDVNEIYMDPNGYGYGYIEYELDFTNETVGSVEKTVPFFKLRCASYYMYSFYHYDASSNISASVKWFANGLQIQEHGPFPVEYTPDIYTLLASDDLMLKESKLVENGYGYDTTVQCALDISTCNTSGFTTVTRYQSFSRLGFEYTSFSSHYGYPATLYPTAPIGCASELGDEQLNCTLHVDLVDGEGNSLCVDSRTDTTRHERCGLELIGLTKAGWDAYVEQYGSSYSAHNLYYRYNYDSGTNRYEYWGALLTTTEEEQTVSYNDMRLKLRTSRHGTGHSFWEDKPLPDVKVSHYGSSGSTITDNSVSCQAYDTQIYDTYSYSHSYEFTEAGDYILFRSAKDILEVQIRTESCGERFCICGVIFRARNDVQLMYFCDGHSIFALVAGDGTTVETNNYYSYWFQRNAHVGISSISVYGEYRWTGTVTGRPYHLSVYMSGGASDNPVEGICSKTVGGMFVHRDGTSSSDFTSYVDSWRVRNTETLMNPFNLVTYGYNETTSYCVCPGKSFNFTETDTQYHYNHFHYTGVILCSPSQSYTCTKAIEGQAWAETLLPDYLLGSVLVTTALHSNHPYFQFLCTFNAADPYLYNVTWYANDAPIQYSTRVTHDNIPSTALHPSVVASFVFGGGNFSLFHPITCTVDVETESGEVLIQQARSTPFYPVKPSTTSIQMLRGSDAVITYTMNIPFIEPESLELEVRVYDPADAYECSDSTIAVRGRKGCGSQIKSVSPSDATVAALASKTVSVTLTTKNDEKYNLKTQFNLKAKLVVKSLANSFWTSDLSDIQVSISEAVTGRGKSCYAHVDPHMKTIDGQHYEMQYIGEYVMLRYLNKPIEVQMKTRQCNQYATCACAVGVRAGADVFVIDHCDGKHFTGFYKQGNNILAPYHRKGLRYQMVLPGTSTMVELNTMPYWNYFMNVDIFMSPSDYNQVAGLCGTYNGDRSDDFLRSDGVTMNYTGNMQEFSDSWEVSNTTESLFNPNIDPEAWNVDEQLCICPNEESHLSDLDFICSANEDRTCVREKERKGKEFKNRFRDRRSGPMHPELHARLARDTSKPEKRRLTKRSTDTVDFAEARGLCQDWFSLYCSVFNMTMDINGSIDASYDELLDNCAIDYQLTRNITWASAHCNSLMVKVEKELEKNPEFVEVNQVVVAALEAVFCDDNCNNRGSCVNGSCSCEEGYIGYSCLYSASVPPEMTYIPTTCIRTTSTCECFQIEGEKFNEGITTSRYDEYEAGEDGIFQHVGSGDSEVEVVDETSSYICIPPKRKRRSTTSTPLATQYQLSVSNDGVNFSPSQAIFVLDTTCQETITLSDGTTRVVLKSGYCYISGTCIAEGAANPASSCEVCNAASSPFSYSTTGCTTTATQQSSSEANSGLQVAYIAVIALSSALLVVVVVVLVVKFKKSKVPTVQPVDMHTIRTSTDDPFSRNMHFDPKQLLHVHAWMDKSEERH